LQTLAKHGLQSLPFAAADVYSPQCPSDGVETWCLLVSAVSYYIVLVRAYRERK
jgi:hypothetical protein